MIIGVVNEITAGEKRVALIPLHVEKLVTLSAEVQIESGLGADCAIADAAYEKAGAKIIQNPVDILQNADILLHINLPTLEQIHTFKEGCITIGYLDPYNHQELIQTCAEKNINAISVEMIPRTTKAQKMDVLSSQANLAGYAMVVIAAEKIDKIFPMMMTPAGTIAPARVLIIGAGVAGLQAIATAKRLGARVEAFDTREVVAEQVQSLGAKFVKIDIGETGQTKDGYAKALTTEQLELQRKGLAKVCANADIVITTAQIPGKTAPRIITKDMVNGMKPGSVVVDMAVTSGGNVEGSEVDKDVIVNGVTIVGIGNLPSRVAVPASQMYSSNMFNFIEEFWDKEKKQFVLDKEDEIVKGCLITHDKEIFNSTIKNHYAK